MSIPQDWQCPKCQAIHAPSVRSCNACSRKHPLDKTSIRYIEACEQCIKSQIVDFTPNDRDFALRMADAIRAAAHYGLSEHNADASRYLNDALRLAAALLQTNSATRDFAQEQREKENAEQAMRNVAAIEPVAMPKPASSASTAQYNEPLYQTQQEWLGQPPPYK